MKKLRERFMIPVIILLAVTGCSKKIVPGLDVARKSPAYDSVSFDYAYAEGLKQKLLGNTGQALSLFEQCITINPKSDAVYFQIAQIALQSGDAVNGKLFAMKAVELNERNIWYLTLLGNLYYQQKKLDSAAIYYEKAIKYYPEKESIKLNLGNIYAERGDYRKAEEIFRYLEGRYGENQEIALYMIKNLVNSGDLKAAELKVKDLLADSPDELIYNGLLAEIYRKAGDKEKASEVYRRLIEKEPGNPQTLFSLIDFLRGEKEYDEIFGLLNSVIISDDISRESKISLLADIIEDDTLVQTKGKEIELSLLVIESKYQGDDFVRLLRPELYLKQGRQNVAVSRLEELIKENPGSYYAWEKLLLTYSDIGDYDNLLVRGKECATRFNMSYIAKVLYASAALEKGEYDIAREELRKAKILAGDQNEMILQVLIMEADLYYREKDYALSFQKFDEALKMNPEDLIVLNNYAYYLAEQGMNLKEAEKMASMVIQKESGNSTYLDTYAWVLFKRGKKREAARIMEDIIRTNKEGDADWFEHYGYIMKSMGKCSVAREYWRKAIDLDKRKTDLNKEIENCTK